MSGLNVESLSVALGGHLVLRDVTMSAESGQLVGLLGPNGAGKTTLMRAVLGLIPRQHGHISVDGLAPVPGAIGYVPQIQSTQWSYPISVEELVMTSVRRSRRFRRPSLAQWRQVFDALELVSMAHLRRRSIAELSGGQQQRVAIARALATKPSVLLLDEPFTGLDHPNQDALATVFHSLARLGHAVVMSTHDLTQAVDICDRVVLLRETVRACGTMADLQDPALWQNTFKVGPRSPLLKAVGVSGS